MANLKGALTFLKRVRTFCIDLKSAANGKKFSEAEWMDLLLEDLKLEISDIEEAGVHGITQLLMVTCFTEEVYKAKLALLEKGVKWTKMRGLMVYGYSTEEYVTTIKVKNWSNFMDTEAIISVLKAYGDVLTFHRGTVAGYPTIFSNFIIVKMKLRNDCELPALIRNTGCGEILQILWEGSDKICFRCNNKGHTMAFCRQKAAYLADEAAVDSWAAIVAGKAVDAHSKKKAKDFPSLAADNSNGSRNKPSKGNGSKAVRSDAAVGGSGLPNGQGSRAGRSDAAVGGSGLPNGHGSKAGRSDVAVGGSGLPNGHGSKDVVADGSVSGSGLANGQESPDMFSSQDFIPATNPAKVVKAKELNDIETSNVFTPLSEKIDEFSSGEASPEMPLNQLGMLQDSLVWYEGRGRIEAHNSDVSDGEEVSMELDSNLKRGRSSSLDNIGLQKSLKRHLKGQKK